MRWGHAGPKEATAASNPREEVPGGVATVGKTSAPMIDGGFAGALGE